jgi:hypothetical protein
MAKQALSKIKQYRKLGLEKTFKERMFFWGSIIAGISFIALWVNSFYYQAPVSQIISFRVEDGWCPETNSGIGLHCFGDYYSPVAGLSMENPWAGDGMLFTGYAYTPIAHQQFVPFDFLGRMFDTPRVGLLAYLLTGFISLLLPLIWAGRGERTFTPVYAIIFGVFGTPLLSALDRGSVVMFTTPILLYYALTILRENWSRAAYAIVLLSVVKPQYLMLLLPLLIFRRWRDTIRALSYTFGLSVIGFVLLTPAPLTVFRQWISFAIGFNEQGPYFYPYNVSITKFFSTIFNFCTRLLNLTSVNPLGFSTLAAVLVLGILLVFPLILLGDTIDRFSAVVASLVLGSLLVPTSNFYYQNFVIVVVAIILRNPHIRLGRFDYGAMDNELISTKTRSFVKWLILIASLNSCFNLPISHQMGVSPDFVGTPTSISRLLVGPLWLLVIAGINLNSWMNFRAKRKSKASIP